MAEDCKTFFLETCSRIEMAVKARWPETLETGEALIWACDHEPNLYQKMKRFESEMDQFWKNGVFTEMKRFCTEWGRAILEIFKAYSLHLRAREAE